MQDGALHQSSRAVVVTQGVHGNRARGRAARLRRLQAALRCPGLELLPERVGLQWRHAAAAAAAQKVQQGGTDGRGAGAAAAAALAAAGRRCPAAGPAGSAGRRCGDAAHYGMAGRAAGTGCEESRQGSRGRQSLSSWTTSELTGKWTLDPSISRRQLDRPPPGCPAAAAARCRRHSGRPSPVSIGPRSAPVIAPSLPESAGLFSCPWGVQQAASTMGDRAADEAAALALFTGIGLAEQTAQ